MVMVNDFQSLAQAAVTVVSQTHLPVSLSTFILDRGQPVQVNLSIQPPEPQLQSHSAHQPVTLSGQVPVGQVLTHLSLRRKYPSSLSHLMHLGLIFVSPQSSPSPMHLRHPSPHSSHVLSVAQVCVGQVATHLPFFIFLKPSAQSMQIGSSLQQPEQLASQGIGLLTGVPVADHLTVLSGHVAHFLFNT